MPGNYKGVSVRLLQINDLAIFVSCAAQYQNLAGVHAAFTTPEIIVCFVIVQKLVNFF